MAEKVESDRVGEETVARAVDEDDKDEEEIGDIFLNLAGREGVDRAKDC